MSIADNDARKEASSLDALTFLLGEWEASGGSVGERGGFRFARELLGRVIVRTNWADYPATADRPAFRHEDLLVISGDAGAEPRADYYDSEGHIIRYTWRSATPGQVAFSSPPTAITPGFRLKYHLDENNTLWGTFEIAPPGAEATFTPYLTWSARRVAEP